MWTSQSAEHSHALYVSFILEAEGSLVQKVQNGLICEVIVTFDRHPAIAVAKLNSKNKI